MKNHKLTREDYRVRKAPPKVSNEKTGVLVQCPFCTPPHPIMPGVDSPCGTSLEVMAIQTIFRSRKYNNLVCIKCHQVGGEMVRFNNSFVHLVDCMPGTKLLTEPPTYSSFAKVVFSMPMIIRKQFEKKYGKAQQVKEINEVGEETGNVLGYFFWR